MAKKSRSLDDQLQRLTEIQRLLEDGEVPVEEMLKLYEEGMVLLNDTRDFLNNAQQRVVEIGKKWQASESRETD